MDAEPIARRPHTWRVAIASDPIDAAALLEEVSDPTCGATALFVGTVRDHSPGKSGVTHLDYEAYEEEVESKIAEIVTEAAGRWPIARSAVEHRIGVVELRSASVAVAVSAPHRADAFDAARYIIDELKMRAPIWKKEHWDGGEAWSRGS